MNFVNRKSNPEPTYRLRIKIFIYMYVRTLLLLIIYTYICPTALPTKRQSGLRCVVPTTRHDDHQTGLRGESSVVDVVNVWLNRHFYFLISYIIRSG